MADAYIFLTDGFEEIEAVATIDILRRGGVDLRTVSLTSSEVVTGGHGIPVTADGMFDSENFSDTKMLILPGGTVKINEYDGLKKLILAHNARGGDIAAICAAPMVLGGLGLLQGRQATCYPGFEKYLTGATFTKAPVVTDGNIITGRGPGLTIEFALTLLERLQGKAREREVAAGLLVE